MMIRGEPLNEEVSIKQITNTEEQIIEDEQDDEISEELINEELIEGDDE